MSGRGLGLSLFVRRTWPPSRPPPSFVKAWALATTLLSVCATQVTARVPVSASTASRLFSAATKTTIPVIRKVRPIVHRMGET